MAAGVADFTVKVAQHAKSALDPLARSVFKTACALPVPRSASIQNGFQSDANDWESTSCRHVRKNYPTNTNERTSERVCGRLAFTHRGKSCSAEFNGAGVCVDYGRHPRDHVYSCRLLFVSQRRLLVCSLATSVLQPAEQGGDSLLNYACLGLSR